jgi:hypothetical protein
MKISGRMFVGAEEWCVEKPWLICRKREVRNGGKVAEEAGCACFECWPKEVMIDTRVCIRDPRLRRTENEDFRDRKLIVTGP